MAELKARIANAQEEVALLQQRRATAPPPALAAELASLKSQEPRVHSLQQKLERLRHRYAEQCATNTALKQQIKQVYEERAASPPYAHLKDKMKANCCKIQELELKLQTTCQQLQGLEGQAKLSRAGGSVKRLRKVRRNSKRGIR